MAETYRTYATQAQQNANAIQEGLIRLQGQQGEQRVKQEGGVFEESRKAFHGAQAVKTQLDTIDNDIKTLGPNWMGTGANERAGLARSYNTMFGFLPTEVQQALGGPMDPEKLASWESFNKSSQKLGFALAKELGSREAMQIVQAATASVPNAEQTYWGARLVSAGMRQAAQRDEDFHKFVVQRMRSGQSTIDAEIIFNQQHPISEYVKKASSTVPPQKAIDYLRANDTRQNRKYFDQTYGDGAVIGVFGTGH
jgi:hypothetical protein